MKNKIKPKAGQESVWDYPRPPKLEKFQGHVRIVHKGVNLADSSAAYRVLETSHPPTYYVPISDLKTQYFRENNFQTFCEFKGIASYFDLIIGKHVVKNVAWFYKSPNKAFAAIKDHACFYASKVEECYVNDEKAEAQEGDFYGGWITKNIVGPFKGGEGTWGW